MSLIITVYTKEGIVMASDSRMTLNGENKTPNGQQIISSSVSISDSSYKTFLACERIGISICGEAAINKVPIAGYIESFINEEKNCLDVTIEKFIHDLIEYFGKFNPIPKTIFHIAGYEKDDKGILKLKVFRVNVSTKEKIRMNPENSKGEIQGAIWDGEFDILVRLIQPLKTIQENRLVDIPYFSIPFEFFTLQDAIDFSVYGIKATIDSMRFQARPKTVGGAIDVLVIKPKEAIWISKKTLKV